jgi:hypothetical protein
MLNHQYAEHIRVRGCLRSVRDSYTRPLNPPKLGDFDSDRLQSPPELGDLGGGSGNYLAT